MKKGNLEILPKTIESRRFYLDEIIYDMDCQFSLGLFSSEVDLSDLSFFVQNRLDTIEDPILKNSLKKGFKFFHNQSDPKSMEGIIRDLNSDDGKLRFQKRHISQIFLARYFEKHFNGIKHEKDSIKNNINSSSSTFVFVGFMRNK